VNRHRLCLSRMRGPAGDSGQITVFVVVSAFTMVLFAGLALDGGLALAAKIRALGQAQEAARSGAQAIDLDAYRADGTLRLTPDQARTRALRYLASTGTTGTVQVTAQTVTVTVTAHQPTQLLDLAGLDELTVTGSGTAHPRRGISAPEP
jgi:putative Flp pilus-assembly TadE/G-like protein